MDNIDNEYIENAIDDLIPVVGLKEPIPHLNMCNTIKHGQVEEAIKLIAEYLGLPITVNLSYGGFESDDLVVTDKSGKGVAGITAQVSIPSYLPVYGSAQLQGFPISIKASENCKEYPETFIMLIAHELCHILLHSIGYKQSNNEIYTDLAAMVLGFDVVMRFGRIVDHVKEGFISTETTRVTYGYLSDSQFDFAYTKIDGIRYKIIDLEKEVIKKIKSHKKRLSLYSREVLRFRKLVEYLDGHRNKEIQKDDARKIVLFHQFDYIDEYAKEITVNEEKLKEVDDWFIGGISSSHKMIDSLKELDGNLDSLISIIDNKFRALRKDTNIIDKYVGFSDKHKLNKQVKLLAKEE